MPIFSGIQGRYDNKTSHFLEVITMNPRDTRRSRESARLLVPHTRGHSV
jgi:hypothetical protein